MFFGYCQGSAALHPRLFSYVPLRELEARIHHRSWEILIPFFSWVCAANRMGCRLTYRTLWKAADNYREGRAKNPLNRPLHSTPPTGVAKEEAQAAPRPASSAFAPVEDLEVVAGIGRKEAGKVTQALGQRRSGQQRILALAQIVVIKIDCEREHVDGQRI